MNSILQLRFSIILSVCLLLSLGNIQAARLRNNHALTGKVIDASTSKAIPFANAVVYYQSDSSLVTGSMADEEGNFVINNLEAGTYFASIQSLGFATRFINAVVITEANKHTDLGTVALETSTTELNAVEVRSKRSTLSFTSDKKVLNVGSDITSLGGTAIDAMKKLPAVQVDYEGTVSIRGSNDFKVLIDGKPTTLSGQEELEKIPVMMIEKIELITNASAEYNAEGTTAIINVLTVKQKFTGFNGMVQSAYNINTSGTAGVRLGYKFEKLNIATGINYNRDYWQYRNEFFQKTFDDSGLLLSDNTTKGDFTMDAQTVNTSLNMDYEPDSNNSISLSGSYVLEDRDNRMQNNYEFLKTETNVYDYYRSLTYRYHKGPQYTLNAAYTRYFNSKQHKLSSNFYFFGFAQNHDNTSDNYISNPSWTENLATESYYYRINKVNRRDFRASLKYDVPIAQKYSINTGYELNSYYRTDKSDTDTDFPSSDISEYDTAPYIYGEFSRQVHAFFALFNGHVKQLNYKLGGRVEAYQCSASLNVENDDWNNRVVKLFPSAHISYNMAKERQLALSYSKRTFRPFSWMLFKIPTYHNKYYTYLGNPDLVPMYTHNAELSFNKKWEGYSFYSEVFYSEREKSIRTVFTPDSNGVRAGYPLNVSHHFSTGSSSMLSYSKLSWLNLQQGFDIFYEELFSTQSYTGLSYNVSTRLQLNLGKLTKLSVNANYFAPQTGVQGTVQGRLYSDIGISRKFWKNNATLAFTVWDPLQLTNYDRTRSEKNYHDRYYYYNDYLNLNLYFSYQFNNYNQNNRDTGGSNSRPSFLTQ